MIKSLSASSKGKRQKIWPEWPERSLKLFLMKYFRTSYNNKYFLKIINLKTYPLSLYTSEIVNKDNKI